MKKTAAKPIRIAALILVLATAFCLAGCGDSAPGGKAPAATPTPAAKATPAPAAAPGTGKAANPLQAKLDAGEEALVGMTAPSFENEVVIHIRDTFTAGMASAGCTVSSVSFEKNTANCISVLENFMTQKAMLVAIFPADTSGIKDICDKARAQGMMILMIGEQPPYEVDGGIISDYALTGTAVADMAFAWVKQKYPGAKTDAIGAFIGACETNQMNKDFQEALIAAVNADDACYVGFTNADPNSLTIDGGYSLAEQALTADAKIRVFMCINPDLAVGIDNYLGASADLARADFCVVSADASQTAAELVGKSKTDESALRGLIPFGTDKVGDDLAVLARALLTGELESPHWSALQIDTYNSFGWTYQG